MTKIFDRFLKDPSSASCGEGDQPCCGPREAQPPCCDDSAARLAPHSWTIGRFSTPAGEVPIAATRLNAADRFGALKMRLGIGRQAYAVPPGLYAVGRPDAQSPVFVSANYKLSFDHLRRSLDGGRGPGHCPGVHFRRTRPWIQATGEWRAEGSSLDPGHLRDRGDRSRRRGRGGSLGRSGRGESEQGCGQAERLRPLHFLTSCGLSLLVSTSILRYQSGNSRRLRFRVLES